MIRYRVLALVCSLLRNDPKTRGAAIVMLTARGEERDVMRPDGDGPAHSIEVVVVRSSVNISKIFYKDGYKEGSTESPDCFSTNGLTPDAASKAKQANTCAVQRHRGRVEDTRGN